MAEPQVIAWANLSQAHKDNVGKALELFLFRAYGHVSFDERIEGDDNVRKSFAFEGLACDLALRRGNRFILGEAKGEEGIGHALLQFANTINAVIKKFRGAYFETTVLIRRGPIYADLPLDSTIGLSQHLTFVELSSLGQMHFSSRHSSKRTGWNKHILMDPSGEKSLPRPEAFDKWGAARLNPPEVRISIASFRAPE